MPNYYCCKILAAMNITIRLATPNDLPFVYLMVCDLEATRLIYKVFKQIYRANIVNPQYCYYVAVANGSVVGFISLHAQRLLHHASIVAEIQELYVMESVRGNGIARMLIDEVRRFAHAKQASLLEVATSKKRISNTVVYEKLGFKLTHNRFSMPI